MKSCPDGYPSCRKAESDGAWCAGDCEHMKPISTAVSGDQITHTLPGGGDADTIVINPAGDGQ